MAGFAVSPNGRFSAVHRGLAGPLGSRVYDQFRDGRLLHVSAIGFNGTSTRAVVALLHDCGFDCQNAETLVLEKDEGRWVVRDAVCLWIT